MSTSVSWNGTGYTVPSTGDRLWGDNVSNLLISLAQNALSKAGGSFTLSAEVDFGATYGLKSAYFKSRTSNISTTGIVRFANNEGIGWRNAANGADLILKLDAGNRLDFNGDDVVTLTSTDTLTNKTLTSPVIGNADNIVAAGVSTIGVVTASAQSFGGQKTFAAAPIFSALTASTVPYLDASKVLTSSAVTPTQLGYLSGAAGTTGTTTTNLVFSTSPTLVTPTLGVASATSINKVTITAPTTSATLTIADGGTLATSGAYSVTLTTTGATNVTLPTSGTLVNSAVTSLSSLATVGTITSGTWNAGAVTSSGAFTGTYANLSASGTATNTFASSSGVSQVFVQSGGSGFGAYTTYRRSTTSYGEIGTDSTKTGLYFGTYNPTFAYVGDISLAGAWTIGPSSFTSNHTVNGGLAFSQLASFPTSGRIWLDTSSQLRMNATGGYVFSNDNNSSNYATISSSAALTVGIDATNQTHLFNGSVTARGYSSGGSVRHLFQNRNTANSAGGSVFVKVDSYSTASDAGLIVATNGTERWVVTANNTAAGAYSSNALGFYNSSGTLVGQLEQAGNLTMGPASGLTTFHTIQNSASANYALKVKNTDTGTGSGGLVVLAGGTTNVTQAVFYVADASDGTNQFVVRQSGKIDVRTTNWATGGTAIGVSSNQLTTSPSSLRYKENVQDLAQEVDTSKVYDLHPVTFDYKKDGRHSFGFIAEEVEQILPCLVHHEDHGEGLVAESVAYDHLAVLLLEEVKRLRARIEVLENV